MKSTFIVTGGAGFIGSHTCDALLAAGQRVIAVDDLSTGKLANLTSAQAHEGFDFRYMDMRDGGKFSALVQTVQPAAIIHLAGLVSVQASVNDPDKNFRLNLELTHHVSEAVRQAGVRRVVFASSAAIYGDVGCFPLREDIPAQPLTPYGAAKAASEHLLMGCAHAYGFTVRCQRYFNVFGPRQDPASPYSGVIAIFLSRMQAGSSPVIFGDGRQSRDFVSVQDVARANVLAATAPQVRSGVANVCSGRETMLNDLVEKLAAITGFRGPIIRQPAKTGDIRRSIGDPSRAFAEYGFRAEWSLDEALALLEKSTHVSEKVA